VDRGEALLLLPVDVALEVSSSCVWASLSSPDCVVCELLDELTQIGDVRLAPVVEREDERPRPAGGAVRTIAFFSCVSNVFSSAALSRLSDSAFRHPLIVE